MTTVNPFEQHTGIKFEEKTNDQMQGTCPFCNKEKHFYFNNVNHLWDCKACMRHGNLMGFVSQIYDLFQNETSTAREIGELRGIPQAHVQQFKLRNNTLNGSYMIPTFRHGELVGMYKAFKLFDPKTGKEFFRIINTSGLAQTLFNEEESVRDTLLICEGHWDRIAASAVIGNREVSAIGVPGAGTWKAEWTKLLVGRHIIIVFDNDKAGREGRDSLVFKHIANNIDKPKSIKYVDWTGFPEGYDLNDFYRENGRTTYDKLMEITKDFTAPDGTAIVKEEVVHVPEDQSCDNFDKVMEHFASQYHVTPDMKLGLILLLASIYSVELGGEQIWVRMIGPPSCGKTTLARSVSGATDHVVLRSTFTGLFSGWNTDDGVDHSMVPTIAGKTLIVKDADALLRQGNIEKIMSELRDFYDKDSSVQYRTGLMFNYQDVHATMVLCGTNALRRSDSSFLGERFLDFELHLKKEDEDKIKRMMQRKQLQIMYDNVRTRPEIAMMSGLKGYINHLKKRKVMLKLSSELEEKILNYATLAATIRTKVDRDNKGQLTFHPEVENPARLIGQLCKTCACIPVVLGETSIGNTTEQMLRKITRDVSNPKSLRYKLLSYITTGWVAGQDLVGATLEDERVVKTELADMRLLNMLEVRKVESTSVFGAKRLEFRATPEITEGFKVLEAPLVV